MRGSGESWAWAAGAVCALGTTLVMGCSSHSGGSGFQDSGAEGSSGGPEADGSSEDAGSDGTSTAMTVPCDAAIVLETLKKEIVSDKKLNKE